MKFLIESLYKTQHLLRRGNWDGVGQQAVLQQLREMVPPPVLAHFLQAVASGRNGAALVSHSVCGECHLRVPAATVASLVKTKDVYLCENCGCYLLLSPDESPGAAHSSNQAPAVPHRRRRRPVAVAV